MRTNSDRTGLARAGESWAVTSEGLLFAAGQMVTVPEISFDESVVRVFRFTRSIVLLFSFREWKARGKRSNYITQLNSFCSAMPS